MYHGTKFHLGETVESLRKSIQQFAQQEIAPLAVQIDQSNRFPADLWKKLGKLGVLGMTVAEKYGGPNRSYLEHAIVMEEISRASASVGLSYGAHSNLCINQIHRFGTEQQKQRYLPPLCQGNLIGALAMSETNAGSDVLSMCLQAEDKGDYFLLNGKKMWITNGPNADIVVVYGQSNHTQKKSESLTAFIVEKHFKGFRHAQTLDKLGMRGSDTCELIFENCEVPKENILGEIHQGTKILMSGLDYERVILAGGPVGIMQACLDLALPYIRERKQFNQPIGEFELIQAKIANIYTVLNASRSYLYFIAQACDRQTITAKDAASILLFVAENATKVASDTIQCLGGKGYVNNSPSGRLLRDAKLYEIGAGTSDIRRIIIGKELFKEG